MPPVSLPGRAIIDLAVSGGRSIPTQFGVETIVGGPDLGLQEIVDDSPAFVDRPAVTFNDLTSINDLDDITIMFSVEGSVEAIYQDRLIDGRFRRVRYDAPPTISFLVGYADGQLDSVLDASQVPAPKDSANPTSTFALRADVSDIQPAP